MARLVGQTERWVWVVDICSRVGLGGKGQIFKHSDASYWRICGIQEGFKGDSEPMTLSKMKKR